MPGSIPSSEVSTRRSTFYSLRYPGASRYFLGLILSMTGTWMQAVGLNWLMRKSLGASGSQLGILNIFQFGPMLVFGAWAGAIADRFDKRKMMIATQIGLASCAAILGVLTTTGHITVTSVYIISALSGLAGAFDTPIRRAMIGDIVPRDALPNAMSVNTSVMTSSRVVGAAVGGFVAKLAGTEWCFFLNGASYLFMLMALTGLRSRMHSETSPSSEGGVVDAIRHVRNTPVLQLTMLCAFIVSTVAFNYNLVFTLLAENVFQRDADILGWFLALAGLGSFIGAVSAARQKKPTLNVFLFASCIMGCSGVALGFARALPIAMAASVPLGLGGGLLMANFSGLLITHSPSSMRGRVLALQSVVFLGTTPIGGPIVGAISDARGARWGIAFGGICALLTGVIGYVYTRLHAELV